MSRRALAVVLAAVATVFGSLTLAAHPAQQRAGLKIVVIAGEDAVNIIQQKTAVAPVVEVRDENDLPVAGVLVTFRVAGGKATFAGGAQALSITTNAAGRAAVATFNPISTGAYQINVTAGLGGQTATATITQTNFLTAAQAAQAGATGTASSGGSGSGTAGGSGGGGLSTTAIVGIVGAGAAATVVALRPSDDDAPPVTLSVLSVSASPSAALFGADTPITFNVNYSHSNGQQSGISYEWDFGDAVTSGGLNPTHVYRREGDFTVRVTLRDGAVSASGQTSVRIRTMSGRWRLGTTNGFFDLTQSGTQFTGILTFENGVTEPVTGSVQPSAPVVTFSWPGVPSPVIFTGTPSFDANVITGVFNGGGFPPNTLAGISRQ